MTNRKKIAAICLALMGLGAVGEGVALAVRPPIPATPPGRHNTPGNDHLHRPDHAADPVTGPVR